MHDHQTLTLRSDICRKIVNTVSAPAAIGPYNQVLQGILTHLTHLCRLRLKTFHSFTNQPPIQVVLKSYQV